MLNDGTKRRTLPHYLSIGNINFPSWESYSQPSHLQSRGCTSTPGQPQHIIYKKGQII